MLFGVSTHLYHEHKLQKAHLIDIAAHGFRAVEVFATRSHFDYHDAAAIQSLASWLAETNLTLHSIHAPITDVFAQGRMRRIFSTATRDQTARRETLGEIAAALNVSATIPFSCLVVHVGVPSALQPGPDDNRREAALRSIEEIYGLAEAAGVRVALEVMGNPLSTAAALVETIETSFADTSLGICMDVGHAHLLGDAADAIDLASEYLITTHIHDNRRDSDDHLVPFRGSIDWPATMMAFQKIGYDGVLMYEVREMESPEAVLDSAVRARTRLQELLIDSTQLPDASV